MHRWLLVGGEKGDCSSCLSTLVARLDDVALTIARVTTLRGENQQQSIMDHNEEG